MHPFSFVGKSEIARETPVDVIADLFRAEMSVARHGAEVLSGLLYPDAKYQACMAMAEKAEHGLPRSYIRADLWADLREWSIFHHPRKG